MPFRSYIHSVRTAWYEWWPDDSYYFDGISFKAGDTVTTIVEAYSTTSGIAYVSNDSTNESVQIELSAPEGHPLCQQDAEWIVEDQGNLDGVGDVPFADFGTVTFTGTSADGAYGSVTASAAQVAILEKNGIDLTSVSIDGDTVTVSYV